VQQSLVVELVGASVEFEGGVGLPRTDLALGTHEAVIVEGPSGAGKTTLLRLAVGLIAPTEGVVKLWGNAPSSPSNAKRAVGLTLDETRLWPWLSAERAVRVIAGLNGVECAPARARTLLAELGLERASSSRISKLSQGMRRRVQVSGALATGHDLFVLDEPTASLDPDTAEQVWLALEARRSSGATLVVASHDAGWRGLLQATDLSVGLAA
jgi:ABC-type multidrug transport system ATPase subunit